MTTTTYAPYSQKYWRELNLAVGSQIAIANISVDLNLVVAQAQRETGWGSLHALHMWRYLHSFPNLQSPLNLLYMRQICCSCLPWEEERLLLPPVLLHCFFLGQLEVVWSRH